MVQQSLEAPQHFHVFPKEDHARPDDEGIQATDSASPSIEAQKPKSSPLADLGKRGLFVYFDGGFLEQAQPIPDVEQITSAFLVCSVTPEDAVSKPNRDTRKDRPSRYRPVGTSLWFSDAVLRGRPAPAQIMPKVLTGPASKSRPAWSEDAFELVDQTHEHMVGTHEHLGSGLLGSLAELALDRTRIPLFLDGVPHTTVLGGIILSKTGYSDKVPGVVIAYPMIQAARSALADLSFTEEPKSFREPLKTNTGREMLTHAVATRALAKALVTSGLIVSPQEAAVT
jgi:hypothetical protein